MAGVLAQQPGPSVWFPRASGGTIGKAAVTPNEVDPLVVRVQKGDRAAFQQLFARHRGDVARLVYRMLGGSVDLDDVVQEVFLQVHRSIGDFRGDSKLSTWLHRITVNVVLMTRRAARCRPVYSAEITDETPHLLPVDSGLAPDEDAHRRERVRAFQRCIEKLAEKKRTVFVLHELEGVTATEIAEIVGAPVLTVRTRLFYARKELCELMREEPTLAAFAARFASAKEGDTTEPVRSVGEETS